MKPCLLRCACLTAALAALVLQPARATTYNELVDTPDEWSVTFSGSGFLFIGTDGPTSPFWEIGLEVVREGQITPGVDGFEWQLGVTHLPDGSSLSPIVAGPYGTTQTAFVTLPHGSAWDTLELSLTVQQGGLLFEGPFHVWGEFEGSWHATHRVAAVPDATTTVSLLLFGLSAIAMIRSLLRRA